MARSRQKEQKMRAASETGMDPAVMASAASVALSWYFFFVRGDKLSGLFVGLWPPTFLAFASYFEQTRMSDMVKKATGRSGGGVVQSIERAMARR